MYPEVLEPKLSLLTEEYVLVQAWKKTASYIRSHNWYADTLELDRAAVNLPEFLENLSSRLSSPDAWVSEPLRIVPAPKSQQWHIDPKTGMWGPAKKTKAEKRIRPLAHAPLEDQVVATVLMLCLADRVETLQGDPRTPTNKFSDRQKVLSYGNRLFCDLHSGTLRHRWGSTKLYRGFFQDYRAFLSRPETVAEQNLDTHNSKIVIAHSDLQQFYDRVTPELLIGKIQSLQRPGDDTGFFDFVKRLLCWSWNKRDEKEVIEYANQAGLEDFSRIALPQGLVASGFFANIVLLDFDRALQTLVDNDEEFFPGAKLLDACRYVDDIRLVLRVEDNPALSDIEAQVVLRLKAILDQNAMGMLPSSDKTQAAHCRGEVRPLVRQSRKMERIQQAISGGFDADAGEEILDAIQGLVRSQERYSKDRIDEHRWAFAPIADVRDETVARFAAARFRSTFRSLRPLLEARPAQAERQENEDLPDLRLITKHKTRNDLDDEARSFALGLIENWIEDPSNVRLLRIGLDLWPAKDVIEQVLSIINPYTGKSGKRKAPRRVAWYCLAEIFRAGATETGFVEDDECFPETINIHEYRRVLLDEAKRLIDQNHQSLPWYLKQQIFLFLAANDPQNAPIFRRGTNPETKHYRDLIRFLKGESDGLTDREFAISAILSRRSYSQANKPVYLACKNISPNRYKHIAERDPSFAVQMYIDNPMLEGIIPSKTKHDLLLDASTHPSTEKVSLAELVLANREEKRALLCNELTLLELSVAFLEKLSDCGAQEVIAPSDVLIGINSDESTAESLHIESIEILTNKHATSSPLYRLPEWSAPENKWRFQLGNLLRFILTGQQDFTRRVCPIHWKEQTEIYRAPESHWLQRTYGHYNGHSSFGADWLPITDWIEQFLSALLRWPGCRIIEAFKAVDAGIAETISLIRKRIDELNAKKGELSDLLMLPLSSGWPEEPKADRTLRICVVQAVIPTPEDIKASTDLTLSEPALRRKHRRHLSAALEAVKSMLELRETHKAGDGKLDFLILPELSVHPKDIETHLVPFARAYKAIILAGMTYEELFSGQPLVNSAFWLIPIKSYTGGLQVLRRRQGKKYLAPSEKRRNHPVAKLQGFRPCQWLVGYKWDKNGVKDPLWLTSSICFDATDIRLAADLRSLSDVYAIPAMNQDVSTFDQMALALQYHMFQMVIVANNGCFGGSNAYAPYREPYKRQVFHLHGQPQASIAFLEIDQIDKFLRRDKHAQEVAVVVPCENDPTQTCKAMRQGDWKCPPAGICDIDKCLHKS